MALQVLSLLSKAQRVSRTCVPGDLIAEAGKWVELTSDGGVALVGASKPAISKLLFNGNSDNTYESNDVSLGRITMLESVGARCKVTSEFIKGDVNLGDDLFVNYNDTTHNGKLKSAQEVGAGTYNIVAKCEQVDADGSVTFAIVSPITITLT